MIIELFGLPASGKTTMARMLEENRDFKIVKIKTKQELVWYNLLFLTKYPIKSFVTFFHILKNFGNWRIFYYKFMNLFLHHNAKYQKAKKIPRAVLDQGYLQNILSVFEKPINQYALKKYLKHLLLPDVLVVFDIPLSVAQKRIDARGYLARKKFGKDYLNNWIKTVGENYNLFIDNLDSLGARYLIIDAKQGRDKMYKDLLNKVWP